MLSNLFALLSLAMISCSASRKVLKHFSHSCSGMRLSFLAWAVLRPATIERGSLTFNGQTMRPKLFQSNDEKDYFK